MRERKSERWLHTEVISFLKSKLSKIELSKIDVAYFSEFTKLSESIMYDQYKCDKLGVNYFKMHNTDRIMIYEHVFEAMKSGR